MLPRDFNYACFISFAQSDRENDSTEFQLFLDELHMGLYRRGQRNSKDGTYFLINNHKSGDYITALEAGVAESVCLVSLYSPLYWDSGTCATECRTFFDRDLSSKYSLHGHSAHFELFAVPWIYRSVGGTKVTAEMVFPHTVPADSELRRLSWFRVEEQCPNVHRNGLLTTLKTARWREEGKKYIELLAEAVSQVVELTKSADLRPARVGRRGTLCVLAATPNAVIGRMATLGIDPAETSAARRYQSYRLSGGPDWHPFAPDNLDKSIGWIVGHAVAPLVPELSKPEEPPKPLIDLIEEAEEKREYVIIVIDPWSVHHFERFRGFLRGLDRAMFDNCMLLVVRGLSEELYGTAEPQVEATLQTTLAKTFRNRPAYFREVSSEEELEKAIRTLLLALQSNMQGVASRPIDLSGPLVPATPSISSKGK
jgi:hypothetical protein